MIHDIENYILCVCVCACSFCAYLISWDTQALRSAQQEASEAQESLRSYDMKRKVELEEAGYPWLSHRIHVWFLW